MTFVAKELGETWCIYDRATSSYPIALAGYGMVRQGVPSRPLTQEEAHAEAVRLNRHFGRPM